MASTGAVTAIVLFGIALSIVSSLYVVSYSSDNSLSTSLTEAQSQITYMEEHPSTTTTTSISTTTHTTTDTISTTYTTLETVTTTRSIFPPSSSSYVLTFLNGTATSTEPQCCTFIYSVDVTYEIHTPLTNGLIVWVKYPTGQIDHSTPSSFPNQAYVTLDAGFSYSFSVSGAYFSSLQTWVTDNSDNVLSPTTNLVIVSQ